MVSVDVEMLVFVFDDDGVNVLVDAVLVESEPTIVVLVNACDMYDETSEAEDINADITVLLLVGNAVVDEATVELVDVGDEVDELDDVVDMTGCTGSGLVVGS